MSKCEWCGKVTDQIIEYTDVIGQVKHICGKCKETADNCECRKCGDTVDPSMMINGLCMRCVQADMMQKNKKREQVMAGFKINTLDTITSDLEFTDKDYETWLTLGTAFSPSDMSNSDLRKIWIMVKLNGAGYYDNETIQSHMSDIEELLDRNFSKLVGNKCKILIGNTPESRKKVRSSTVIDYEKDVYILQA